MKKRPIIITSVIVVLILVIGVIVAGPEDTDTSFDDSSGPLIVANPLDLTQIKLLSKFRSCAGHDYSGHNADNEPETDRSMKHYITPNQPQGQVKIFSPFNGTTSHIELGQAGHRVHLSPDAAPDTNFIFFHVNLLPAFNQDSAVVTAGQHIGYAHEDNITNFDMGMRIFGGPKQLTVSPFNYMSSSVLAEYSARGVTLENIIKSTTERDADPCTIKEERGIDSTFVNDKPDDFVQLQ